jgi:hypothetical protein
MCGLSRICRMRYMEKHDNPQSPEKRHKFIRPLLFLLLFVGAIVIVDYYIARNNDKCYSVSDVWENASIYLGEKICIRGKAEAVSWRTLKECELLHPCCNQSWGELSLVSESSYTYNPHMAQNDYIAIDSFDCSGNECGITCSPFDPFSADYFEFYGILSTSDDDGTIKWLDLVDIDFSVSRQFVNGVWQPIPIGTFEKSWPTVTPHPKSND